MIKYALLLTVIIGVTLSADSDYRSITEPAEVDVARDVYRLWYAMDGWGTYESILIDILTHRYYDTRMMIADAFEAKYGQSLWYWIYYDTSGHFMNALKGLVMTEEEFLARDMHTAMSGSAYGDIINILLMTLDEYDTVQGIKQQYESRYDVTLQKNIESLQSGNGYMGIEKFLVAVLNRPRFETDFAEIDIEAAVKASLNDVITLRRYVSEGVFPLDDVIDLFTSMSSIRISILIQLMNEIPDALNDLEAAIGTVKGYYIQDALMGLLTASLHKPYYLAKELHKSMDGLGTDEDTLTRIIVTRADKDMEQIKTAYLGLYGNTLKYDVYGDTSWDYETTLANLIN